MKLQDFILIAMKLKDVKRQGWVERGVANPESSADHSWMAALMCLVLAPGGIDRDKAARMALVHDLAEAEVGDIITKENWEAGGSMGERDKIALERKALDKMLEGIPAKREMMSLWEEYERRETTEALFVRDVDVAERLIQAYRYHKSGNFKEPLEGFWDEKAFGSIGSESIKALVKNIIYSST